MPPKKIDPEVRQREYQAFKESDEWKKMEEIHDQIKINLHPFISETSRDHDLNGKYQHLWNRIFELSVLMKVKAPFKKIEHEWMRSIYFGEKRKADKNEPPCMLDGFLCEFQPIDADSQHHLRQALIKRITNIISEKDNFDIDSFSKNKTEVKKGISQLFSLLKTYAKKSFKVIYEDKFMEVLKPFSDLLEINIKLVLFELKYTSEDAQFINSFKKQAIIQRYCQCLERVLEILMTHQNKPISFKIQPQNVFKKLYYTNLTKIQHFYLDPFSSSFDTMKKGLCALFTTGINFWKVPIEENKNFVEDFSKLVQWELVCERHFGNELARDQINFMANALSSIDKANELSKKYMIERDPNCMEIAIPRLVAFKTIQHMREYKDKEDNIRIRQEEKYRLLGQTLYPYLQSRQEESFNGSLKGSRANKMSEGAQKSRSTFQNSFACKTNEFDEERSALGRYWIWEDYCDNQFKESIIEEAVEYLKNINKAVQQDIEDIIIREGMLPRKQRHNQDLKMAADTLKNMKTIDNSQKSQNMIRPPQLWNFQKVFEEEHRFRSIADPKKCYIDGRIEKLDFMLGKISKYLMSYNKRNWNELVRRVIDFYDGKPDSNPAFEDE